MVCILKTKYSLGGWQSVDYWGTSPLNYSVACAFLYKAIYRRFKVKTQELKNYGKGFADLFADPQTVKVMRKAMSNEFRKQLGLLRSLRLMWKTRGITKEMRKHDWSRLKEHGLTDQHFLDNLIQSTALAKALIDMVGAEKASEIYRKMWDNVAYDLMTSVSPSVEEFKACGDVFESFKEYMNASNEANQKAGLHEVEIVEDTKDTYQCNFNYCIWNEVAKEFGDAALYYDANCYGDEAWMPKVAAELGCKFERTGTLVGGAKVCDFRFERLKPSEKSSAD
jgi:predicted ArsR family transcriptional regulator